MAGAALDQHDHEAWIPPTGEELANRLFVIVLAGVGAVIVLMVTLGGWWAA